MSTYLKLSGAAVDSYRALARRIDPDSTPEQAAALAARLAEADVLGLLWNARHDPQRKLSESDLARVINQCRQTGDAT